MEESWDPTVLVVEGEPAVVDSMVGAYGGDVWFEAKDPEGPSSWWSCRRPAGNRPTKAPASRQ